MSTVGTVNASPPNVGTSTPSTDTAGDLSKNFMQMLLAQLRNQDPLNPMDSAAMTGQLAQLNMVSGINATNDLMRSVLDQIKESTQMQLSDMTGKYALVDSDSVQLMTAGEPVQFETSLSKAVDQLTLSVTDATGREVFNKKWDALPAGVVAFQWDGKAADGKAVPAGHYTIQAWSGQSAATGKVTLQASQLVLQAGLDSEGQIQLYLANGQQIGSDSVKKWLASL